MIRIFSLAALTIGLMLSLPLTDCWARGGRGGGASRGGFSGGASRGGFSGGASRGGFSGGASRGGFSGGASHSNFGGGASRGSFSGGASRGSFGGGASHSNFGGGASRGSLGGGASHSNFGGSASRGSFGGGAGLGGGGDRVGRGAGGAGLGGAGLGGDHRGLGGAGTGVRGAAPSRSQLSSFLGMPSDSGMGHLGSTNVNHASRNTNVNNFNRNTDVTVNASGNRSFSGNAGDHFDVTRGAVEGPRGGVAAGGSVTGPRGNTAARGAAVGPNGGVAAARGVQGAGGARAAQGAAAGPGGRVAAGGAVEGRYGGAAGRGVVAGPHGAAAGFARVTPSGRYTTAVAVRGGYHNWGVYNRGWYAKYPGAWFAAGWAAHAIWTPCTWGTAATYCGYGDVAPIYYDYGNNITYEGDNVYVNGQDVGTGQEYYDQAADLAETGEKADASTDDDWMPLGVFALTKTDTAKSDVTIQLAVNKEGVIRGNATDSTTDSNQVIQGSVDKKTQKVAFVVGDNKSEVVETGLYNLTKDEAPVLVHYGKDRTEQWLLVRLKNPDQEAAATPAS